MKWSKTLTAMVLVMFLSGVAAVMEVQGRQAVRRPVPAAVSATSAPVPTEAAPPTLPTPTKGSAHPITG